jgi:hypothetical protein
MNSKPPRWPAPMAGSRLRPTIDRALFDRSLAIGGSLMISADTKWI